MNNPMSKVVIIVKQDRRMSKVLLRFVDSVENPILKDTSQKGMNIKGM